MNGANKTPKIFVTKVQKSRSVNKFGVWDLFMGTALQKCFTPSAETELQVVFFVQRLNRVFKKGKFESVLLHQSQKLLPCLWVVPETMNWWKNI